MRSRTIKVTDSSFATGATAGNYPAWKVLFLKIILLPLNIGQKL